MNAPLQLHYPNEEAIYQSLIGAWGDTEDFEEHIWDEKGYWLPDLLKIMLDDDPDLIRLGQMARYFKEEAKRWAKAQARREAQS